MDNDAVPAMRVRYSVVWMPDGSGHLVSMLGTRPMTAGWYRIVLDDYCNIAYEAGPCQTAEEALTAVSAESVIGESK